MMIQEYVSLQPYTTFMTRVSARHFFELNSVVDMQNLIQQPQWQQQPYIIGGGSNLLFTQDYDGLIIYNAIKGREIIHETDEYVDIKIASGELWHDVVMWTVEHGWWGMENLSLIPGTVGASPVQNIGAYGVEVANIIHSVEVLNLETGIIEILNSKQCRFGYRNSIFKQEPGKYFVTAVIYRLSKIPRIYMEYGAIVDKLAEYNITDPSSLDIANIISEIRRSKLPDVGEIGMGGSFFKNPVVTPEHAQRLLKQNPDMPQYSVSDSDQIKIPAGWIIETLGYKGIREGNVGTYHKHALVLVNYGEATGSEVWSFAQKIIQHAQDEFGIQLEPEVIVI